MPLIRLVLILALIVFGSLDASEASAQPSALSATSGSPTRVVASLSGRYRFVSGRRAIARSIDAVCDELDFVTRAFARPILEDRNQPYDHVELEFEGDAVRFILGPWGGRTRLGTTRTLENERGEQVRTRQFMMGHRLVQTMSTDEGSRRNILSLSADGRRLTVDTLITSPRLPIPIRYRLTYERLGGQTAARVAMR